MRVGRRIIAALLVLILCAGVSVNVYATGTDGSAELTPEQQLVQEELNRVYELPVQTNEIAGWPQGPGTYGEAAIIMEADTGAILYAKNIDDHHYPASITKVLTALIALENGQPGDTVTFSHDCVAFLQPGDSSIGLKEGNVISLEQALYATLLASANEAAYAVGENVGINCGHDYSWFVEQMNARCEALGGHNSHFANTNGLHDPDHYTCARDMALIGSEIFKHPEFFEIVQTLEYIIPVSDTVEEHVFQQKDKMLRPTNANYYEYAVGGKTGYTSDALSTLITMADNGQMKLVCVVLRTHGKNIYPDTRNLCEYAFSNFVKINVAENETSEDISEILAEQEGGYVMLPGGVDFSAASMEITPDEDESGMATLTYTYEGNMVGSARALLTEDYMKEHFAKNDKKDVKDAPQKNEKKPERSQAEKWVLRVLVVLLAVLIVAFVIVCGRMKRRLKKKRKRRRVH